MRGLYFGNLSNNIAVQVLSDSIIDLCYILGCCVDPPDVIVKKKNQKTFALVDLPSEDDVYHVLSWLQTWESRKTIKFSFCRLTDPGQPLKAAHKHEDGSKKKHGCKRNTNVENNFNKEQIQKQKDGVSQNALVTGLNSFPLGAVDSKIEAGTMPPNSVLKIKSSVTVGKKHYLKGEKIGSETRSREFKLGGGDYPNKILKVHVRKYMCGFLNSREEGKLMIGIHDDGTVIGIDCDQKQEDDYRLDIDMSIKDVRPPILPDMYTVEFVPVYLADGRPLENKIVLEITVKSNEMDNLYETKEGVFFRRDGSLQGPLCAADIQEWTKKKYQTEVNHYRHQEQYMMEQLQNQQEQIRSLEEERKKAREKKSKVCSLM